MRVVSPLAIDAIKSEIQEFITEGELMLDADYECLRKLCKHIVFRTPPARNMRNHVARVMAIVHGRDRFTDPVGGRYLHFSPSTLPHKETVLQFCSEFEGGNLKFAGLTAEGEYLLALRGDVTGSRTTGGSKFHFYFGVRNSVLKKKIRFRIININRKLGLYEKGMKIWTYSEHHSGRRLWRHGCSDVSFIGNDFFTGEQSYSLGFTYDFQTAQDCTFFALSIPYTYSMVTRFLADVAASPFVEKLVVSKTVCNLECRGLKITNPAVDFRKKKHILVTARMHPSEPASSWLVHGFVGFLLSNRDPTAELLRNFFVFTVVPMLNPDGVVLGNTRLPHTVPLDALGSFALHMDLHGHCCRRGFFCDHPILNRLVKSDTLGINPLWFSPQYCPPNVVGDVMKVSASEFGASTQIEGVKNAPVNERLLFVPGVLKLIGAGLARVVGFKFGVLKMPPAEIVDEEPFDDGSSQGSNGGEESPILAKFEVVRQPRQKETPQKTAPSKIKSFYMRSSQLVEEPTSPPSIRLLRTAALRSASFTPSPCGVPSNALVIQPMRISARFY